MHALITPSNISGNLIAPASKSMSQRALAGALLHKGMTTLAHLGSCDDELAAMNIITQLGAQIEKNKDVHHIYSQGIAPITNTINCQESGLSARLFAYIVATSSEAITLTGTGTLLHRKALQTPTLFAALGVNLSPITDRLPFTLQGPLKAQDITVDGSHGSQELSGLLFALAFTASHKCIVTVTNLKSKPYIDLTINVLQQFGKEVTHSNYEQFIIDPEVNEYIDAPHIAIEGDWSGAANFLVAGAIGGPICVKGLDMNSSQADKLIIAILEQVGATISQDDAGITVQRNHLNPFIFNAVDAPDLMPILAVLAANCLGISYLHGIHRLINKESNRLISIQHLLTQLKISYEVQQDTLCIHGGLPQGNATIQSYNDHRIAMAATIAGLHTIDSINITEADCVAKSYPRFFEDIQKLGGNIKFQ